MGGAQSPPRARAPRARRSSLFDVGSTARAINVLDLQVSTSSNADALGGTADVKRRLARFSGPDMRRLRSLAPEDVVEGATLVRLSLGEYVDTISRHRRLLSEDISKYLVECVPIFVPWQPTRIAAISRAFELRRYPDGHVVYRQGDVADALCLVREGSLELYRLVDSETSHLFPTGACAGESGAGLVMRQGHEDVLA